MQLVLCDIYGLFTSIWFLNWLFFSYSIDHLGEILSIFSVKTVAIVNVAHNKWSLLDPTLKSNGPNRFRTQDFLPQGSNIWATEPQVAPAFKT